MQKRSLLVVEWDDVTTCTTWHAESRCKEETPIRTYSVGWRLPASKGNVAITPMRAEYGKCNDIQIIPRGCIRNIRRVE